METATSRAYDGDADYIAYLESKRRESDEENSILKGLPSEPDPTTPLISYFEALRSDFRRMLTSAVKEQEEIKMNKSMCKNKIKESQKKMGSETTPAKTIHLTDLPEEQVMALFSEVPLFRFEVCKVFLSYNNDDENCKRQLFLSYNKDCRKRQLFGIIQVASVSRDPGSQQYGSFNIFNRKFNNPIVVTNLGHLSPHNISCCSLPVSTSVKITAQLYVTTDKVDDMERYRDYHLSSDDDEDEDEDYGNDFEEQSDWDIEDSFVETAKLSYKEQGIDNYAFEICNDSAFINFSDYFAKRPVGGSGCYISKGKDGYLELHYVALKYAIDAALEVEFAATCKEKKVAGRVIAYYGKNFDYGCPPAKRDLYKAMLFVTKPHEYFKSGKINLMRSVLAVPAQFSLVIDAHLHDFTSGDIILSGTYEFFVPLDGRSVFGSILSDDGSLKLKVDWKLPFGA